MPKAANLPFTEEIGYTYPVHALRDGTRLRRIGKVAEASGLTQRAIRYYEELGLLKPAAHLSGANRRFDDEDLERLRLIKRLRDVVGLELAEVQTFLETDEERRMLRSEYLATSDPARRGKLLARLEPILRRRVAVVERKLAAVTELLSEERGHLERVSTLREQYER